MAETVHVDVAELDAWIDRMPPGRLLTLWRDHGFPLTAEGRRHAALRFKALRRNPSGGRNGGGWGRRRDKVQLEPDADAQPPAVPKVEGE